MEHAPEGSSLEAQTLAQEVLDVEKSFNLLKERLDRIQVNTCFANCCSTVVDAHASEQSSGLCAQTPLFNILQRYLSSNVRLVVAVLPVSRKISCILTASLTRVLLSISTPDTAPASLTKKFP